MNVIGIDIGGTQVKAGVVDAEGAIQASRVIKTPASLKAFRAGLQDIVAQLAGAGPFPAGIGVGCKGIINPETSRVEVLPGTLHFLEGQELSELIRPSFLRGVPVHADNDARVAIAGECIWGAAQGLSNVLMLTLGTGVGGAVIADGRLLRGHSGVAGHIGHLTLAVDGPACICGNHGCLETLFSARAIEAEAFSLVMRGCDSKLTQRFAEQPHHVSCEAVFQAAEQGDAAARLILDRAIHRLGAAIAGLLHVFDSEIVILGGRVTESGAALLEPLRAEVAWRTRRLLGREVPLVEQKVADKSGIVGAAALVLFGGPLPFRHAPMS